MWWAGRAANLAAGEAMAEVVVSNPQEAHQALLQPLQPSDIHILLVDDERLTRLVVSNLLRACKYKGEGARGPGQR